MTKVELLAAHDAAPADALAYADADWILPGARPAARLVVRGSVDVAGAERAAGIALIRLATKVQERLRAARPGGVEIVGKGLVAGVLAQLLGDRARAPGDRPATVVDTTGDPGAVGAAIARLDDLGALILAGEAGGRPLELDLYPDVHVRGLHVIGVGLTPADIGSPPAVPAETLDLLGRWPAAALAPAAPGTAARWYRVA
jgi:hypothetical protein